MRIPEKARVPLIVASGLIGFVVVGQLVVCATDGGQFGRCVSIGLRGGLAYALNAGVLIGAIFAGYEVGVKTGRTWLGWLVFLSLLTTGALLLHVLGLPMPHVSEGE